MDTVTIVVDGHPDGRVVINASDYDPDQHTLWVPAAEAPAEPEAPAKPKAKGK